jgi:hypothetical protein
METSKNFTRPCPACGTELRYSYYQSWHYARKTNQICRECRRKLAASDRNSAVVALHSAGMTNRQIAKGLGVSHRSVGYRVRKLGLSPIGKRVPLEVVSDTEARCKKCEKVKDIRHFAANRVGTTRAYRLGTCNSCRHQATYERSVSTVEDYLHRKWLSTRVMAKQRGVPFGITEEEFIGQFKSQDCMCFYTGAEMYWSRKRVRALDNSVSVDKVIPELGYVSENVVFCCSKINMMKNNMTLSEMEQWTPDWYRRIAEWRKG